MRRIVLSGFSAGVAPIINMLGTQVGQKLAHPKLKHELFGAAVAPFLDAWKEVWDHDAPDATRKQMDGTLPHWLMQDKGRMARCYQSDYTSSRNWIQTTPLTQFVSEPLRNTKAGSADAAERHATARCSLVFFGTGYLHHTSGQTAVPTAFWSAKDDHQAVPVATFGHAALLSGLQKQ